VIVDADVPLTAEKLFVGLVSPFAKLEEMAA
jgi:hypothetical protein